MKKKLWIVLLILIFLIALYLNRAYAHVYNEIGNVNLLSPDIATKYVVQPNKAVVINYVAIGDSLTSGVGVDSYTKSYPYLLAKTLTKQGVTIQLSTAATPGGKTDEVIRDLKNIIAKQPNIITLLIGINDMHNHVSLNEFKENYETIIKTITEKTNARVYVINLPFIGDSNLMLFPYNYYFNYQTQKYNKVIEQLALSYKLTYIDLYSSTTPEALKQAGYNNYYSADSFHPNELGYTLWSHIIYDHISK